MDHSLLQDAVKVSQWLKPKMEIWLLHADKTALENLQKSLIDSEKLLSDVSQKPELRFRNALNALHQIDLKHPTWKLILDRIDAYGKDTKVEIAPVSLVLSTLLSTVLEVLEQVRKNQAA
jgi:hypothetical protein